ncbi:RNA polymerase sigma factor [Streptomyces sp. YIM 98790]|uniref:RNA polymerase sigma factor n=1 Tax=Streptomyces sp. YIM 98790 TaxID=2689077 RepID=UPI001408F13F|nr:sigma-70 family RNA polymerase sigma factor [Streptomyces sp. YIM 98790]
MPEPTATRESGSTEEFDAFFERSFPGMLARARLRSACPQDADDALQEAYTAAFRRWDSLRDYESPDAWVYKVLRQRLAEAARRRRRAVPSGLAGLPQPHAADPADAVEVREALRALDTLPGRQRMVMILHTLEGMPQQEIADLLKVSRATVAVTLYTARRKLEKLLGRPERGASGRPSGTRRHALIPAGPQPARWAATGPVAGLLRAAELALRRDFAGRPELGAPLRAAVHGSVRGRQA